MACVLSNKSNELRLQDNISNSIIVLHYRTPTAAEQAKYTNGMTKRVRNKIVNCTGEQRQKYGAEILTGFREGDFIKAGKPGDAYYDDSTGGVRFASDKNSQAYDPEWKTRIAKFAPDLIEALAIHAFEQTAAQDDGTDLDDGSEPGDSESPD